MNEEKGEEKDSGKIDHQSNQADQPKENRQNHANLSSTFFPPHHAVFLKFWHSFFLLLFLGHYVIHRLLVENGR